MSKLTERQKATYELIKKNSLAGRITTQREIYENYPANEKQQQGYKWNDQPYSHDNCSVIWSDIVAINFSDEVEEIIIAKDFTYEIARNSLQALEFAKRYKDTGIAKFKRYGAILRKIKANGTATFTELENELHFIDSYMEQK